MPIPPEAIVLTPGAPGTLQERLRAVISAAIVAGRFRAGERMPSSRALARQLGLSRITVSLAYADLVAADYLSARGRSGHFVSAGAPLRPDFALPEAPAATGVDWATRLARPEPPAALVDRPADWARYPWPFIYGQPDTALVDHANWRACALRALGRRDIDTLATDAYDRDDPLLVETIRSHILPRRGIAAGEGEVLVTMGAQNALWLAAQLLLAPGRRAVMENPGYPWLRALLLPTGAQVATVDVDAGGLPPAALPETADAIFATPSHQCPTGATMPLTRRVQLIEAAAARGAVIVEDDYEFEMSFLQAPSPALKSLDAGGRVIYVGSLSKSLFPGLRLGYLVAPPPFIAAARALRSAVLRHPPGYLQRTAAYFVALGHYDAAVNRTRAAFRRRHQAMAEAIVQHGLTVAGSGGTGGSSLWMRAPGVDTAALALRLRAEGVLIEAGGPFFDPARPRADHFRLAWSSIAAGRIAEGIARIAAALA
jgi:GntR family transcriptional regulator/MocR family aminotransferase